MDNDKKSLEEMSGSNDVGGSPKLLLNEIRINGNSGQFLYKDIKNGRTEKKKDKDVYSEVEIGESIEVVFLKIRRKMSQFKKDGNSLNTNEHNHKDDFITLFGAEGGVKRGIGSELRDEYQGLRTVQVVYALYKGELVRLIVKGSSLNPDSKPEGILDFYSYIASFNKDEDDKKIHFYEFFTKLVATKEEGEQGDYFSLTFEKGKKLTDDQMKKVKEPMTIAFDYSKAVDEYVNSKKPADAQSKEVVSETKQDIETIEYPEEDDIDPEDIPF